MTDSLILDAKEQAAEVLGHRNNLVFDIRLEDGRQVIGKVPLRTARHMFIIPAGACVRVIERLPGEFRILGFDGNPPHVADRNQRSKTSE